MEGNSLKLCKTAIWLPEYLLSLLFELSYSNSTALRTILDFGSLDEVEKELQVYLLTVEDVLGNQYQSKLIVE